MLRLTIAFVFAMVVCGDAESADRTLPRRGGHRTTVMLPAGLPRPHYVSRTTIVPNAPYPPRRNLAHPPHIDETSELLFTPTDEPLGSVNARTRQVPAGTAEFSGTASVLPPAP